jgi:hypothetical protein
LATTPDPYLHRKSTRKARKTTAEPLLLELREMGGYYYASVIVFLDPQEYTEEDGFDFLHVVIPRLSPVLMKLGLM